MRDADNNIEFAMKPSDGNVKIEQMKKMMNSSKTKISSNNFSSEQVNIEVLNNLNKNQNLNNSVFSRKLQMPPR